MGSGYRKFDAWLVGAAARCAAAAWRAGVPFPFLLAAWRLAFLVPALAAVAWWTSQSGEVSAKVALAILAVTAVPTAREVHSFCRDGLREWTDAAWKRYMARAAMRRDLFRLLRAAINGMLAGSCVAVAWSGAVAGEDAAMSLLALYMGAVLSAGGYLDVCEPPRPGDGGLVAGGRFA